MGVYFPTSVEHFRLQLAVSEEEKNQALKLRHKVFVNELGYSADTEIDDYEGTCDHFLLMYQSHNGFPRQYAVGVCRLEPTKVRLGRVAILKEYRGAMKSGSVMLLAVLDYVRLCMSHGSGKRSGLPEWFDHSRLLQEFTSRDFDATQPLELFLFAQKRSVGFYERNGFRCRGDEFIEKGVPHQEMYIHLL